MPGAITENEDEAKVVTNANQTTAKSCNREDDDRSIFDLQQPAHETEVACKESAAETEAAAVFDCIDDDQGRRTNETRRSWRPAPLSLTLDEKAEAKEAYKMFDVDAAGKIRLRSVKMALRALGVKVSKHQVAELMEEVADQEPEGWVSRSQFVEIFPLVIGLRDVRKEICKAFDFFDHERTGSISFPNIKRVAMEAGEELTDADIREMIEGIDKDGDGVIRRAQFDAAMGKPGRDPIDDLDSD